ncbi:MAG: ricin-type beta-trefoil lectin domain protein [Terracidiphilus sp.]
MKNRFLLGATMRFTLCLIALLAPLAMLRAQAIANGTYTLTPENAPALRLDDEGAKTTTGNPIDVYTANDTGAQNWTFSDTGVTPAGYYNLATEGAYCLTASGTTSGSIAVLDPCAGTSAQAWEAVASGSNWVFHPASNTALCLDVEQASSTSGTGVQVYTCNSTTAQSWASAMTFTSTQATNIWNSYNSAFYVANGGDAYYRKDQGGGQDTTDFWYNAEELEMAVDRAQRSGSAGDKAIVTALVNGFDATYGSAWTSYTIYNDDVMWACLAHLRAYFVTGSTETAWAVEAANNFNWVYNGGTGRSAPQYDSTYGGGLWWTTDHSSTGTKNACVNGPGALVGYYLSVIYPSGTGFLGQAQNMNNWERNTLVTSTGYVYDHTGSSGVTGYDLSYNAGTYIGASYLLGNSSSAGLAATYFMDNNGILPDYGTGGGNDDGFNGIFMRWMALYMIDSGTQATYSNWLYNNAGAALSVEDSSGLSWDDWSAATPSGGQYSWDCSPSVVALQVLPPN